MVVRDTSGQIWLDVAIGDCDSKGNNDFQPYSIVRQFTFQK